MTQEGLLPATHLPARQKVGDGSAALYRNVIGLFCSLVYSKLGT